MNAATFNYFLQLLDEMENAKHDAETIRALFAEGMEFNAEELMEMVNPTICRPLVS